MKLYLTFLFVTLSLFSFGQGRDVPIAGVRLIDSMYVAGSLKLDSVLKIKKYATSDSNKVLGTDASGNVVLRTKQPIDTSVLATQYDIRYLDTVNEHHAYSITQLNAAYGSIGGDGAQVFQLGDSLYRIGLWNAGTTPTVDSDIYSAAVYDPTNWHLIGNTPFKAGHAIGNEKLGDTVYNWGRDVGSTNSQRHKCWAIYINSEGQLSFLKITDSLPYEHRLLFGTASDPSKNALYTFGGQVSTDSTEGLFTDIWKSTDGWRTATRIATGLNFLKGNLAGAVKFYRGDFYVIGGGIYGHTTTNTVYKIHDNDDGTVTVTQLPNGPWTAVYYPALEVYDGKLFKFGGSGATSSTNNNEFHYMDRLGNWTRIGTGGLVARHASTLAKITDTNDVQTMLLMNGTGNSNSFNDVWRMSITTTGYVVQFGDSSRTRKVITDSVRSDGSVIVSEDPMFINSAGSVSAPALAIGASNTGLHRSSASMLDIGIAGTRYFSFDNGGSIYCRAGTTPGIFLGSSLDVSLFRHSSGALRMQQAGAVQFEIDNSFIYLLNRNVYIGAKIARYNSVVPSAGTALIHNGTTFEAYVIRGSTTKSGDGAATSFTIAHGLSTTPTFFNVTPKNAASAGISYMTADATNITINYTVAPATGTNNLSYAWIAIP